MTEPRRFWAAVSIEVEADNADDAAEIIHSILEPAEQDGHICTWGYLKPPQPEGDGVPEPVSEDPTTLEVQEGCELRIEGADQSSISVPPGKWGEWVVFGTVAGREQKARRPLDKIASDNLPTIAHVGLALHDRIAALEEHVFGTNPRDTLKEGES